MKVTYCKNWHEIDNIPNKNGIYIDDEFGTKRTYKDNEYNSYNGKPAIESSYGSKHWYRKGKYHRLYDPAIECSMGTKSWYLFGIGYSEDDYNEIINNNVLLFLWKNRDKL